MPGSLAGRLYNASPFLVRRVLANAEAVRRDWFRRGPQYEALLAYYATDWYALPLHAQQEYQIERLNAVLAAARSSIPYYRATLPNVKVATPDQLQLLPELTKESARRNPLALVREGTPRPYLWRCTTSGSTGTPLVFYHDRDTTAAHQAVADAVTAGYDCRFREPRVRFSGAGVAPYEQRTPPFWIYIDRYRQLQCSAYHLSADTYPHYVHAIAESGFAYGSGYASAWHLLATYLTETGGAPIRLRAIFSDSEGMTSNQQLVVERAFGCLLLQTYGTGEVGQVAQQCPAGRYHVLTRSCIAEVVGDDGNRVGPGGTGEIVVTDLTSFSAPMIRYRTGDLATVAADPCTCGWQSPSWIGIVGRIEDRVYTPEGRWIGRLGHVMMSGVGVRESQLVQTARDELVIRVVPAADFVPDSMAECLAAARRYLGPSMRVRWEIVPHLERTANGKLRYVVRLFNP